MAGNDSAMTLKCRLRTLMMITLTSKCVLIRDRPPTNNNTKKLLNMDGRIGRNQKLLSSTEISWREIPNLLRVSTSTLSMVWRYVNHIHNSSAVICTLHENSEPALMGGFAGTKTSATNEVFSRSISKHEDHKESSQTLWEIPAFVYNALPVELPSKCAIGVQIACYHRLL